MLAALLPRQLTQVAFAAEQDIVQPDKCRVGDEHFGADLLAPEPLLQRVEARSRPPVDAGHTLVGAADKQLAVEDAGRAECFCDIRKTARDVIASAAVEPSLAAGMDELNADPVPLPLRRIIGERDSRLLKRVSKHKRPEHWHVADGGLGGAALRPVEQLGE